MKHSHLWHLVLCSANKPWPLPAFKCIAKILMPTPESSCQSHQKSWRKLMRRRHKMFLFLTLQFGCYANIFMLWVAKSWHLIKHDTSSEVKSGPLQLLSTQPWSGSPSIPVIFMTPSHKYSVAKKLILTNSLPPWVLRRNNMLIILPWTLMLLRNSFIS